MPTLTICIHLLVPALASIAGLSCGCDDYDTALERWSDRLGADRVLCTGPSEHYTRQFPWEVENPQQWEEEEMTAELEQQLSCLVENAAACRSSYGRLWTWSRDAMDPLDIEIRQVFTLPSCEIAIVSLDFARNVGASTESVCTRLENVGPYRWVEGDDCTIRALKSCD